MKKPTAATPNKKIAELAAQLRKYKDAYYNATPLVSDAAYDALEDKLRALAPDHEVLKSVGSPAAVTAWEKARHAIPMGSLNKAVNEDEFRAWAARCEYPLQVPAHLSGLCRAPGLAHLPAGSPAHLPADR